MWGRLQTRDRFRKMGLQVEETCPLCGQHAESADHVLIQCNYAQNCWLELNRSLQVTNQVTDLSSVSHGLHKPASNQFRTRVIQCCYTALLYHIWMQRNSSIWHGCIKHYNNIV
ncbi:50S ribosomal protein L16 [Bienertia sinuspersici]